MSGPGYWMHESSGILRPAVEAYLTNEEMTAEDFAMMRAYLRQWVTRGAWFGDQVEVLKARIDRLVSREAIEDWLDDALGLGIDPL